MNEIFFHHRRQTAWLALRYEFIPAEVLYDPRRADDVTAVELFFKSRFQPPVWMDEANVTRLTQAFHDRSIEGIGRIYRTRAGRLPDFLRKTAERPVVATRSRDRYAYLASFHNFEVFKALWENGFIAKCRRSLAADQDWFEPGPGPLRLGKCGPGW